MVNPIPFRLKKLWDHWNIRGALVLSLLLQVTLILVAPVRKRTSSKTVIFVIWCGYLLADVIAVFAVGLISSSQGDTPLSRGPQDNSDLLAFWAPFLLVHLGGPDTITAFTLEDNELWIRHLLSMITQATGTIYVFVQTLPNNKLWIPTLLIFLAGCIKYLERIFALYYASMDKFRNDMLKEPDAGPNYAKLMEQFTSNKHADLPTRIITMPESDSKKPPRYPVKRKLDDLQLVQKAHSLYKTFRGMTMNLIFSFKDRDKSRDFFNSVTATTALRVMEVELNLIYEVLFTKVTVVRSMWAFPFRLLAFLCLVSSLAMFRFKVHKRGSFNEFDVGVTYALLLGAVALDLIAFTRAIFSDWTTAAMMDAEKGIGRSRNRQSLGVYFSRLFKWMWRSNSPKRQPSQTEKDKRKQHHIVFTSAFRRRWSECIYGYDLIRHCFRGQPSGIHKLKGNSLGSLVHKIRGKRVDYMLDMIGLLGKVDELTCISREPLTKELWKMIFSEVRKKSQFIDDLQTASRMMSVRGNWVLEDGNLSNEQRRKLMAYVQVPYDESLLIWHVATVLLYNKDGKDRTSSEYKDANMSKKKHKYDVYTLKENSKILSDYMLYLLVMQPKLMVAVAGVGKIRFEDTCAEAKRFFEEKKLNSKSEKDAQLKACKAILEVETEVKPINLKGDRSKSVLFDASMLAKELETLDREKWKIICHVWVELLCYAASHCRGTDHAQLLSKGGELVTFVWLLMAHFGITEQFQIDEGHPKAQLLVGK